MWGISANAYKKEPEYLHAKRSGAPTKIIVSTHNDEGMPISNATIKVLMGMQFREKAYFINGITDEQGQFIVEGVTKGNEIEITAEKDGYYSAFKKMSYIKMGQEHEVKDGKWQPWGLKISLPLREKCNPVALVRFYDGKDIPTTNQWFGFDMQKKDWVASGHLGITPDFEVFLNWDGKPTTTSSQSDLCIRFVGEGAGYYLTNKIIDSKFKGIYHADTNAVLRKEFICKACKKDGGFVRTGIPSDKIMIVRSRCKLDARKNIVEANYSSLMEIFAQGGWHGTANAFMYYLFNPTPNDTNLEAK